MIPKSLIYLNLIIRSASTNVDVASSSSDKYELLSNETIEEFDLGVTRYRHTKSGADVISVRAPQDDNKVFGITFRTPPSDSTGIAHIMEHSVLCGSRKYTSKEPFVELLKGSLQTFLNAFTYPDRTCYPVASQNLQDYHNLINVYLDAVLHPRALKDPQVLQQEGWHYELEDLSQDIKYKGVVYNEMKGVYSSPEALSQRHASRILFPDTIYSYDYGGDPPAIPDLTFEMFRNFHETYYHPSNARIFFYGDDDESSRLSLLSEYLDEFEKSSKNHNNTCSSSSNIQYQPKLNLSNSIHKFPYPVGEDDTSGKHIVTMNWLLNDKELSEKESLSLVVLDHLLLATSSSPLYKNLIESRVGESVTGGGLSDELLQSTFSVGLKGVIESDVGRVEEIVNSTFEDILKSGGFEADAIRASVNSLEFQLREFNTGSFPKGLSVMLGIMKRWIYDISSPEDVLRFEKPLRELKEDLENGKPVLENLIRDMFLENKHRATIQLYPDSSMEKTQIEQEEARLKSVRDSMSQDDLLRVIEDTKALKEAQSREDTPEQRATIPRVELDALTRKVRTIPFERSQVESADVLCHDENTGGILYADLAFEIDPRDLNQELQRKDDVPLLSLYSRLLFESGSTSKSDEVQLSRRIGANTGGISASVKIQHQDNDGVVFRSPDGADEMRAYLLIRGKAVRDRVEDMWDIVGEVLNDVKLEDKRERVLEILHESRAGMESTLTSSGHSIGATHLNSQRTVSGAFADLGGGLRFLDTLPKLIDRVENDWDSVLQDLQRIHRSVVRSNAMTVSLTSESCDLETGRQGLARLVRSLPSYSNNDDKNMSTAEAWRSALPLNPRGRNLGIIVPTQVNYVSLMGPAYKSGDFVPGSSLVASRLLSRGFLWDHVRVMGGAYVFYLLSPLTLSLHLVSPTRVTHSST